jgi:UDP-N-acetylglucosamine 2-epimerase (non-hydrolysing)
MSLPEIHLIGGGRADVVRLGPVVLAMREAGLLAPALVVGGHHSATLAAFDLTPDITLRAEPGPENPDLTPRAEADPENPDLTSRAEPGPVNPAGLLTALIGQLDALWTDRTPAAVLVSGDSITSLAGALGAYWRRIPVVHLGAGLRPGDLDSPFPPPDSTEEANRRLLAQVTTRHLAPTPLAAMNLLDEDIATADVLITGTTVVDATLAVAGRRLPFENPQVAAARATAAGRRLLIVTTHRRESWGAPLDRVLAAVRRLIERYADIDVILSSHPNPAVRAQVEAGLGGVDRVTATGPLSYADLSRLLSEAYLVLTDSGSTQEQAPAFGVPALVLRDVTALDGGGARLVGSDTDLIVKEAAILLDSKLRRDAMTAGGNPYGDGLAAVRTAQATAALLGLAPAPAAMPAGLLGV